MTSKSKHSNYSCSQKAAFVYRVQLGCNFAEHFENYFEKTKYTVRKIELIRFVFIVYFYYFSLTVEHILYIYIHVSIFKNKEVLMYTETKL